MSEPIKSGNKILTALSLIGPGLFLLGYNIGTGSITTMAKAGAEYGMSLFWALLLSCIFTYVLMVAYGQVTLVSGKTALFNFKIHIPYGKAIAIYIIIALVIGELLALMGIMGIAVELMQEAFRILGVRATVSKVLITVVMDVSLLLLLWFGNYKVFEKVLTFFVVVMVVCFVGAFVMLKPDMKEIVLGLAPRIPNQDGSLGLIAAMGGTTCSAALFVVRSIVVSEKGWGKDDLKNEKRDAFVSSFIMLFLSAIIMAVAAGTLHIMGLKLNTTIEMVQLFEPLGSKAASIILILGILGAALSTVFPIILIAPWLICDYTQRPKNMKSSLFRTAAVVSLAIGTSFLFIDRNPPIIMIFSQAFQALILPAVTLPIFILINKRSVMGIHSATPAMNIGIVCVFLFGLLTSYFAIAELF
ncbi:MAG TPA: Nramp family divalent metal transporter [Cyclobacteriaceae bacterium]|nr:Nramp family divalent metal transporter [Cyclobacteriaceae bacterium]